MVWKIYSRAKKNLKNHTQNNGKYYNRLACENIEKARDGSTKKKVRKYKSQKSDWLKVNSENYKKVVVFIVFGKPGDLFQFL